MITYGKEGKWVREMDEKELKKGWDGSEREMGENEGGKREEMVRILNEMVDYVQYLIELKFSETMNFFLNAYSI